MPDTDHETEGDAGGRVGLLVDRADALQRRVGPIAFTYAVLKHFGEDRGAEYSALLAYYGFFSLLPLMLVVTTVLAKVIAEDPARQQQVIDAIVGRIPVAGTAVADNVHALDGSGVALLVGLGFVVYGGLGVINAAQEAFNTMWAVPRHERPAFWSRMARSLAVVAVVGVALLLAMVVGTVTGAADLPGAWRALGVVISLVINAAALLVCFELLTGPRLGPRRHLTGAIVGAVGLLLLQLAGAWYMTRVVGRAGALYGAFAAAIGLLVWIGLLARVLLLAGEVNVVRAGRLWPRSLSGRDLTDADRLAFERVAQREALRPEVVIDARVAPSAPTEAT